MLRSLYMILMLLYISFSTIAQQAEPDSKEAVHKAVTGFFDGLAALDVSKSKSFCTEDITLLEDGQIWNFDSLAVRISNRNLQSKDFKRINKIDFIKTTISGDMAWVAYHNQATITYGNKTFVVKWLESVVAKKDAGEWKINLLHSTELARDTK